MCPQKTESLKKSLPGKNTWIPGIYIANFFTPEWTMVDQEVVSRKLITSWYMASSRNGYQISTFLPSSLLSGLKVKRMACEMLTTYPGAE